MLVRKYGEEGDPGLMGALSDARVITRGDRYVVTKCSGFGDVTIDIRYYDTKLKELAESERIELEAAKVDDSGL